MMVTFRGGGGHRPCCGITKANGRTEIENLEGRQRIQGDSELCGRRKEMGSLEYESSEEHLWKTEQ